MGYHCVDCIRVRTHDDGDGWSRGSFLSALVVCDLLVLRDEAWHNEHHLWRLVGRPVARAAGAKRGAIWVSQCVTRLACSYSG